MFVAAVAARCRKTIIVKPLVLIGLPPLRKPVIAPRIPNHRRRPLAVKASAGCWMVHIAEPVRSHVREEERSEIPANDNARR